MTYTIIKAELYGKEGYVQIMPTLKLHLRSEDGKEVRRYLQPFRNYSFQLSGTDNGDGAYGDSGVIPESLSVIAALSKDSAYRIFSGLIYVALKEGDIEGVRIPPTCLSSFGNVSFRDFINETIAYAKARHGLSADHDPYEFGMEIPNYNK
jgi:hypothetical protein